MSRPGASGAGDGAASEPSWRGLAPRQRLVRGCWAVPSIVVDHVSRWYGNVVAVNDISFSLSAGVTGLLGPNGAGKTTLLHLVAGLLRPSAGSVTVAGVPAWRHPTDVPRRRARAGA